MKFKLAPIQCGWWLKKRTCLADTKLIKLGMIKKIETNNAPKAPEIYSQAIVAGNMVFLSGQLGIDPSTGKLPESFEDQAQNVMNNLKAILQEADSSFEQVVKVTIFLDNMANYAKMNEIYLSFFPDHKPARSCIQVAALPLGGKVEIELIAVK